MRTTMVHWQKIILGKLESSNTKIVHMKSFNQLWSRTLISHLYKAVEVAIA